MFLRSLAAFLILPGSLAFALPVIFAVFDPWKRPYCLPGALLIVVGFILLLRCIFDFITSGRGALAPWDPPTNLVITGLYRYMRNPMYVSVILLVAGWSAFFVSPVLAVYTCFLAVVFYARVLKYEEPRLASRYGREWPRYTENVNRWIPRF